MLPCRPWSTVGSISRLSQSIGILLVLMGNMFLHPLRRPVDQSIERRFRVCQSKFHPAIVGMDSNVGRHKCFDCRRRKERRE